MEEILDFRFCFNKTVLYTILVHAKYQDQCNSLTVNLLHQTLSHFMSRMRFPPGSLRMISV